MLGAMQSINVNFVKCPITVVTLPNKFLTLVIIIKKKNNKKIA